jgi:leader peptidase (prepilin peptidase) / N-methyltransferase
MPKYQVLMWLLDATWVLFIFAYGACLGSLINVIAYRVPKGLSIVRPPSRCPQCDTKLSWRDNIPVLGWIMLGGKCRYCKKKISAEYPVVEACVGLLFLLFYAVWYLLPKLPRGSTLLGYDIVAMVPRWAALNSPYTSWPEFVLLLILLASLFAMTMVDAKTFTIPIQLTWVPAVLAVIVHPLHAAYLSTGTSLPRTQIGWTWAIPTPFYTRWDLIGLSIGGIVGLGIGLLLIRFGLIGRSFADYAEWEAKAKAEQAAALPAVVPGTLTVGVDADAPLPLQAPEVLASPAPSNESVAVVPLEPAVPASPVESGPPESDPSMWMSYPHARREMVRELAFLAPCLMLMLAGWYAGWHFGGMHINPATGFYAAASMAPLWLMVLSGVLLGYLIGGGVVWAVRIAGTLGFGKEAMGLGDVHLMAGVGACLGWIDSTLAFFGAAFVGLAWAILGRLAGGGFKRMLPYGPFLAVSTVLVLLCKPLIEKGLTALTGTPIHLPP